ncbi:MAG: M48 family metallopeptidase [Oleispira antarctica]|nr:M48 family metallopeptidase [Oleispira antarctica]MBQ0793478.1 M48 family metallopeptidase [Oleispira antarctica]|tara:strand:- start:76 stop:807 length:732 start_codon:yes stop_codon:yes gene_type:complete
MSPLRQSAPHKSIHQTSIQLLGREVAVTIHAMKRKSLRLGVNTKGEIEVKVPLRCPKYELMAFLSQHTGWLEKRLEQFDDSQQAQREKMQHLGKFYRFQQSAQKSRQPILIEDTCYYPQAWSEENLLAKIESWQRLQAKQVFEQLIDQWWPHFAQGALISRPVLRVKKMRSRWGSLSSKGYINLNLKLLELSPNIIEMVVVHELCHSHYFDHSANFYRLMAQKLPGYKAIEIQLRHIEKECAY